MHTTQFLTPSFFSKQKLLSRAMAFLILGFLSFLFFSCNLTSSGHVTQTVTMTKFYDSVKTDDSALIVFKTEDGKLLDTVFHGRIISQEGFTNLPVENWDGKKAVVYITVYKADKIVYKVEKHFDGATNTVSLVFVDVPLIKDTMPIKNDTNHTKPLPPVLEAFRDTAIQEGQAVVATMKLVNATDSSVEIKGKDLPSGSAFRMNGRFQGEFSWTPGYAQSQVTDYAVTFSVIVGGATLEKTVRIKVRNTDRPPVFSPIKNQATKENVRLTFGVPATDLDGNDGLIISVDSLPRGAFFSHDTFSWTPEFNQAGNYSLKFTVSDGELKDSQTVAITVGNYNRPPDIEAADTLISENDSLELRVSTVDPDGQAPGIKVTGLPPGSVFKPVDSLKGQWLLSWRPSYSQGKSTPYEIIFASSDDSLTTTKPIKVTVKNINLHPSANAGKDSSLTINDIITLRGTATDSDGSISKMEWDFGGTGNFVQVSKPDTNIKAPPTAITAFNCIFKVTDNDGATAMDTVSFKVTADAPIVKVGKDTVVDPGDEILLKGTATDDGKLVEKSWSCNGSSALSPSIDVNDAVLKLNEKDDSTYRCIFKVVDDDGMSAADTIKITAKLNWTKTTDSAGFGGRDGAATVVFKDRIWVIGGSSYDGTRLTDIWSTADGSSWRKEAELVPCLPRYGHTVVEFGGRLWLMGGAAPIGGSIFKAQSDVWSSFDGVNWTREKDSAAFNPRQRHTTVVFNNKIWIMGGQDRTSKMLGDSWYSADGANWTLANVTAFPPRVYHKSIVFNNKMWIVGGYERSDILSSPDGITWTDNPIQKPFYPSAQFFQVAVHAGKVWAWEDNHVWLSSDMSNWGESTTSAPIVGRLAPLEYHGKLWSFGGITKDATVVHSIWYNTPN